MSGPKFGTRRQRALAAKGAHAARLAAVQALYQVELSGASPEQVIAQFAGSAIHRSEEGRAGTVIDAELFERIVRGAARRAEEIDDVLAAALSKDWALERLEVVLRALLRAAAFELLAPSKPPARVVIAEYVALAGGFFSGGESKLANGVLNRLAHVLRPKEFEPTQGLHVEPSG